MIRSRVKVLIKAIVFAVIFVCLVNAFAFTSYIIPFSGDKKSNLCKNDRVLINKWSYGLRLPFTYVRLFSSRAHKDDLMLFDNPNPALKSKSILTNGLYIDRCMGEPGDTLMLNDELIITNDNAVHPDVKKFYIYPQSFEDKLVNALNQLGIKGNKLAGFKDHCYIRSFSYYECYLLKQKFLKAYPLQPLYDSNANSHPFIVPAKGLRVKVYPWNMTILCNTILNHENRVATITDNKLWIDGTPVDSYKFTQDYYWVVSDNPLNLNDSRLFGFVPQSHLIGKPWFVWCSSQADHLFQRIK